MNTENSLIQLKLILDTAEEVSSDVHYDLLLNLRRELRDSEAESIELTENTTQIPLGAKSLGPLTWDAMVVTISVAALPGLLALIQNWLSRQQNQYIKVKIGEIEVEVPREATKDEINQVVETVKSIRLNKQK